MTAGKDLVHHRSMTMKLAVIALASSYPLIWGKKVCMVDRNCRGFQANALLGCAVGVGFVVMNCASRSSGHVLILPSLHSSYRSFELQ